MPETQHEIERYIEHIAFPVTKEELINGLLVRRAPSRMIAVVERLPRDRYDDRHALRRDLEEIAHVHAREVAGARAEARTMQERLDAAFADLRGTMSAVYDERAPIDPHCDLPRAQA